MQHGTPTVQRPGTYPEGESCSTRIFCDSPTHDARISDCIWQLSLQEPLQGPSNEIIGDAIITKAQNNIRLER